MEYIAQSFGNIFFLCFNVGMQNYLIAMVLFTLISKTLLLPISIWTQKNSIKMVKLQPELNMLKVRYFGDKDKIADETTLLYKKMKYNPFVGIIPMFIQIIILLGIIEVVKHPQYANIDKSAMMIYNINLSYYPFNVGGGYWSMPVLAGMSALFLSFVQNHLNPLQVEQSKSTKYGTLAFSVSISLLLGAFVPVAVGLYWVCSNLFSILQQLLLNIIINPHKYIDHKALEESRKRLCELKNIGTEKTKIWKNPYISKERKDYKRFFSVINKHIVFYSEKNGFYKYFESIINYLLTHSNLIIHYITSDPNDNIFELEKENNRIRAYYIGERRLITLMMKMDADIVVMTMSDLENYHIKRSYVRKDIEYIYMFHYPLSTHMVLHTGALDHYDTIFCIGDFQIPEIRKQEELHHLPPKNLVICGYGQLEKLQQSYDIMNHTENSNKRILIAPSWQEDNILDSCIDELLTELLGKGLYVIVRPHPEYVKRYKEKLDSLVQRYQNYKDSDLKFELDFSTNESIFNSDIVITDWSGTAYEFSFVTGKPSVFIDTPMKINNPEYLKLGIEPLEISLRKQVGIHVDPNEIDGLYHKIIELLKHQTEYIKNNIKIRNTYIANYGHSNEIGGRYIIETLKGRSKKNVNIPK